MKSKEELDWEILEQIPKSASKYLLSFIWDRGDVDEGWYWSLVFFDSELMDPEKAFWSFELSWLRFNLRLTKILSDLKEITWLQIHVSEPQAVQSVQSGSYLRDEFPDLNFWEVGIPSFEVIQFLW